MVDQEVYGKEIPALMPENIKWNHKNSAKDYGLKYSGIWRKKFC